MKEFPFPLPADLPENAAAIAALLCEGGDERIVADPATGLNRYFASPFPRDIIAYASSTANDISPEAFEYLCARQAAGLPGYTGQLAGLRSRIAAAYGLGEDCGIVFAPSGTDLEYVALAAVHGRAAGGVRNILLGADEVGSGCIHSAHGRYFAATTALGVASAAGEPIAGFEAVDLVDIPVRDPDGAARSCGHVTELFDHEIALAVASGRHALVHVVHGSKTGLVLPTFDGIDALAEKWGAQVSFVVDACQARISREAINSYLLRDCIVLLTGSKFMGGPPFSGFALVPSRFARTAGSLPSGLATIFAQAEWPEAWPGREQLPERPNPGLAMRLDASIFELERFLAIDDAAKFAVIEAFQTAVETQLEQASGYGRILPSGDVAALAPAHPTAMQTLVTLDMSSHPAAHSFDQARELHRALVDRGIRLGQPVKCLRDAEGTWGGTLRIGLSMPQIARLAALETGAMEQALTADMRTIAEQLALIGNRPEVGVSA